VLNDYYLQIRLVHISAVIASGALFLFRGVMLNAFNAQWTRALPLRITSWSIDTELLTAAVLLTITTGEYPFVDAWLTAKVTLLVLYIGLGATALSARRSRIVRSMFLVAAVAVFLFIVSIARAHDPLGIIALLFGRNS
jgi:uncharacterized membrane protein SirB2